MNEVLNFVLIFISISCSKSANVTLFEIELTNSANALINGDLRLSNLISTCNSFAKTARKNLMASNVSNSFITSFNNFLTNESQTIKSNRKLNDGRSYKFDEVL